MNSYGQYCPITEAGQELQPVLERIGEWGMRWLGLLNADELEPGRMDAPAAAEVEECHHSTDARSRRGGHQWPLR